MTNQAFLPETVMVEAESILAQTPEMKLQDLTRAIQIWQEIDSGVSSATGDDAAWLRVFRDEHGISFSTLNRLIDLINQATSLDEITLPEQAAPLETTEPADREESLRSIAPAPSLPVARAA